MFVNHVIVSRPCKRCVHLGKSDSCIDIQHKKRGRPKISSLSKRWQSSSPSDINDHYHTFSPINNIPTTSSFKLTQQQEQVNKEPEQPLLETMTVSIYIYTCEGDIYLLCL